MIQFCVGHGQLLRSPASDPLASLSSSLDALAGQDLDHLSTSALGDGLVSLHRLVDRLEAEVGRRLLRFHHLGGPAAEGASSTVSWLVSRCRLSPGAAASRLTLARHLPDLPETGQALRDGEIGAHHAAAIARTAAQRRADALVELCSRQLGAGGLPRVAGQRPHLTVTAPLATLHAEPGAPAGELAGAGPVVAETVRRLACDAALTTVTVGAGGEPLGVARTVRTVPPPLRRALLVRDRGCRFPGCDRPPDWCEAHHRTPWSAGGPTTLDNLALLCHLHHRRVHEEGWRLVREPGGHLRALPP